jgi:hypothetical protein
MQQYQCGVKVRDDVGKESMQGGGYWEFLYRIVSYAGEEQHDVNSQAHLV